METNYLQNPWKVIIYNPVTAENLHTKIFIGAVPQKVAAAIEDPRRNAQILRDYYGADYNQKLGLDIKDLSSAYINPKKTLEKFGAGNIKFDKKAAALGKDPEKEFSRDVDFSDIEQLLHSAPNVKNKNKLVESEISQEDLTITHTSEISYEQSISLFPEDKLSEVKEKIFLSTGIPTYRQHLFYIENNHVETTYNLITDSIQNIDIRSIAEGIKNGSESKLYGAPIDKRLYENRKIIKVEALDTFKILDNVKSMAPHLFVTDLAFFTANVRTQLIDMLSDTYQFELFYFGFIVKYWPQLTQECFHDFILSENEMAHKYPDLARNKLMLQSIYKNEKEIIDYNYKNLPRALNYVSSSGISIAVTQMTAIVTGEKVLLDIRNLFDYLRVSRCVPEIHGYVTHENKKILLRKTHALNGSDIQFPPGNAMKSGITIAISLRRSDQETFHKKATASTTENEQNRYMFLNIWPNGKYFIRTVWNEEDEYGFDDIIKIMKDFTDPIISLVNSLGRHVFISGSMLSRVSRKNISYQGLNICIFWKKVMLESTFKMVKSFWELYMKARVTAPRNVQQFDKYEFLFRKGIYDFDASLIERIIIASNGLFLTNSYEYLSNPSIKQKWLQNYDGRVVQMSHRTTDVRFEVLDIREKEFIFFYRYIICFIYRAATDEKVLNSFKAVATYKNVKKLKKLRLADPELFNLKKYGSKKVYSVICQNKHQPIIYNAEELKTMPAAEVKRLTKYWNFTLRKPAYYGCPTKKYPHLRFMTGVHPKHYCLPCCNKKPESGENAKVHQICLKEHSYFESKESNVASRHIMAYGKEIDIGRLSKLPQNSLRRLLFD